MILSAALILLFLAAGTFIADFFSISIPGSVIGMVLLTLALISGIVKKEHVKPFSELLINHMALFFVPAGVGLMVHTKTMEGELLPIILSVLVSTAVVMAATGFIAEKLDKGEK